MGDVKILREARKVFTEKYPGRVIRELSYGINVVTVKWFDVYTRMAGTSLVDPRTGLVSDV